MGFCAHLASGISYRQQDAPTQRDSVFPGPHPQGPCQSTIWRAALGLCQGAFSRPAFNGTAKDTRSSGLPLPPAMHFQGQGQDLSQGHARIPTPAGSVSGSGSGKISFRVRAYALIRGDSGSQRYEKFLSGPALRLSEGDVSSINSRDSRNLLEDGMGSK